MIDQRFFNKLKGNGVPDEHVRSIELLIEKFKKHFDVEMRDNPKLFSYQFRYKHAEDNIIYNIDDNGMLWVRQDALYKFSSEKKIATLYETLKQLTGWKWKDHKSTTNPAAAVSQWHDKVDEVATAMINVLPRKDDEDLDEGEET